MGRKTTLFTNGRRPAVDNGAGMARVPRAAKPKAAVAQAKQRLFFAVRPSAAAASRVFSLARQLQAAHGLSGKPIPVERLHITLHWLRDHVALPPELVERAVVAGGIVDAAPFEVAFDCVESLGDASRGGPLVLTGSTGLVALRRIQRALSGAMIEAGLGAYAQADFMPHVTLLYDDKHVARQAVDPIRWTVSELVLVHSVVGEGRHVTLGQWSLQSRQSGRGAWRDDKAE